MNIKWEKELVVAVRITIRRQLYQTVGRHPFMFGECKGVAVVSGTLVLGFLRLLECLMVILPLNRQVGNIQKTPLPEGKAEAQLALMVMAETATSKPWLFSLTVNPALSSSHTSDKEAIV